MTRSMFRALGVLAPIALLSACAQPGAENAPNVYSASQVNTRQEAHVISILAVLPAKVQVSNAQNQRTAEIAGTMLGALAGAGLGGGLSHHNALGMGMLGAVGGGALGSGAGAMVPGQVLVDGVSLTYEEHGHTYNSAQVGRQCEYVPGRAIMVMTGPGETRVQPNATCPAPAKAP